MKLKATSYKFKKSDTKKIIGLGYTIHNNSSVSFETFINTEFANFNLEHLLQELEASFAPTTTLSISRDIYISDTPPILRILLANAFTKDAEALIFDRKFVKVNNEVEVYHNFCIIPVAHQKKGIIKKVFQVSFQQYVNIDASCIKVHAGLSGGGHVWARHGFVAVNQVEVKAILESARKTLSAADFAPVQHIFTKYYTDHPTGREFPMILWAGLPGMKAVLMGSDWHGEIDLKNSNQFSNFMNYVFRS